MCVRGEHEIYCCGARVRISEKGVKVLAEPTVEYCSLHEAMYGSKQITVEIVRKDVETKIRGFGFCCRNRGFDSKPIVAYGSSEMMRVWLEKSLIDGAVVVCEGAGTVITANGKLAQAIGARLTGIIKTSPIDKTIEYVESNGGTILDRATARVDQLGGVKRAFDKGFKRIAVSVAGYQSKTIDRIRQFEASCRADILIFSVCNTCITETSVKHIAKADIVCASASRLLRTKIGSKALMQLGVTIPVYALTDKSKRLVLAYLAEFNSKLVAFRAGALPYGQENTGPRLKNQ
jgi:putative methanogenesis marker protein 8